MVAREIGMLLRISKIKSLLQIVLKDMENVDLWLLTICVAFSALLMHYARIKSSK